MPDALRSLIQSYLFVGACLGSVVALAVPLRSDRRLPEIVAMFAWLVFGWPLILWMALRSGRSE